jgi:hypothetical protein
MTFRPTRLILWLVVAGVLIGLIGQFIPGVAATVVGLFLTVGLWLAWRWWEYRRFAQWSPETLARLDQVMDEVQLYGGVLTDADRFKVEMYGPSPEQVVADRERYGRVLTQAERSIIELYGHAGEEPEEPWVHVSPGYARSLRERGLIEESA